MLRKQLQILGHRLYLPRVQPGAGTRPDCGIDQGSGNMRRLTVASLETVAGSLLFGQAGPIRPPVNSGAAVRGKRIYLPFCIN